MLGSLAALVHGEPAKALTLIGVTGTQGKTTVTQLVNAGVQASGRRTAVIGTMGTWIDGRPVKSALTTPEAPDLHALFAVMRELGVEVCAMEVSSHAIVMGRVDGVVFDLAVFTNFGRDHWTSTRPRGVLRREGRALHAGSCPPRPREPRRRRGRAAGRAPTDPDADVRGRRLGGLALPRRHGHRRRVHVRAGRPGRTAPEGRIRLAGPFNVANALAAIAASPRPGSTRRPPPTASPP